MPHPGHVIETADGERIEFVRCDAECLEIRVRFKPYSEPPPVHYHPRQDEEFEVLNGDFEVAMDGVSRTYRIGDTFSVPAGARHRMHCAGDEFGEVRWTTRPALRSGEMFERIWGVKRREHEISKLVASLGHLKAFAEHRDEIRMVGLLGWVVAARWAWSRVGLFFALFAVLHAVG